MARPLNPMAMARAAQMIQAAARGFLVRRRRNQARREPERRPLMSPMDIQRRFKRVRRQGQVRSQGVFPKARIGSLVGTVKSKRPVSLKKLDPHEIKLHVDTSNTVLQAGVAYFGFPDAGSQDEQLKQGCFALTNMFFRRSGIKLATVKTVIGNQFSHIHDSAPNFFNDVKLRRISILYVKWNADGSGFYSNTEFGMDDTKTIEDVGIDIYNDVKSKAINDGQWPIVAKLWSLGTAPNSYTNAGADVYSCFATYDLKNVMVDFAYMRKYKWQNVTPSGGVNDPPSRSTVNDVMANPLSGRIYKFKGPTPLIRGTIQDNQGVQMPALDLIQQQGEGTAAHDYLDTRAFRYNLPEFSFDNALAVPFKQPFKSSGFFKNTLTEDKVYMPPGGYKQLIRKEKISYNFTRFCQATVFNAGTVAVNPGYIQPKTSKIGTCTLWALEPAVRTAPNENVKIMVNSELWYTTKCRVADKKQPVVSDVKVLEGFNFQED